MKPPKFIAEHPQLALFALFATATSGFGQTFFISVFGHLIRDEFVLSNSAYGLSYGGATLVSALLLLKFGALVDTRPLPQLTLAALLILVGGCLMIGLAAHWLMLIPGFLLIRFGGQGLLSHLGVTVAGRYFHQQRGRVMALTVSGFPLAESTLPLAAGLLLVLGNWRLPWFVAVTFLLLVALPMLLLLARHAPPPDDTRQQTTTNDQQTSLTRNQVLRDPGFYLLLPAALATPFTITAILFHQAAIVGLRGWPLEKIGVAFTGFALGHLLSLLVAGPLVDRLGAQRTLAVGLLPLVGGLLVLAIIPGDWALYLYLLLTGGSLGGSGAAAGALWPERYGTRHLGAIRSVASAIMVVSTALAPVLVGFILDITDSATLIGLLLAALVSMAILLTFKVRPPGNRLKSGDIIPI
ncbi:MFS transporter [Pelovirga terrestris]|uniref:MFS transporter n=1 Tax=Pelovirga terrestris TaxID=2771352 RepID=A0A8J6QSD8_9BACT|nr:MFS transporter [Pelovirga terrestris]MBD1400690.1 MFS transporter [Pelovirga terrestris]